MTTSFCDPMDDSSLKLDGALPISKDMSHTTTSLLLVDPVCENEGPAQSTFLYRLFLASVWLVAVLAGMAALVSYSLTPGSEGAPAAHWPQGIALPLRADRPTLIMTVHPRCPCSRASLNELSRLMAAAPDSLWAYVLFVEPDHAGTPWEQTDLWRTAARIPGVVVSLDRGGQEARQLGAATSGQALLYEPTGRLLFAGGITPGRGHAGDSIGRASILDIVGKLAPARATAPVFGCPLEGNEPIGGAP
jgi:hypothetical protein